MSHSDPIIPMLAQFQPLFTAPTWKKMMILLTGTMLEPVVPPTVSLSGEAGR